MGRGNCCVNEQYEGLFYVDYDDIDIYAKLMDEEDNCYDCMTRRDLYELGGTPEDHGWEYDEWLSQEAFNEMKSNFSSLMCRRFPSFSPCDYWVGRDCHAFLENDLFYIAMEDNQWSVAIELLQKDDPYGFSFEGLQKLHHRRYLDGIRDCLFEQFDQLGVYGGPWTHGMITRAENAKMKECV